MSTFTDLTTTSVIFTDNQSQIDQFWDGSYFWDENQFWDGTNGIFNLFTDLISV